MTVMKMLEHLETQRLLMRVPCPEDATVIFDGWAQDREVTRYLTWRRHDELNRHSNLFELVSRLGRVKPVFPT